MKLLFVLSALVLGALAEQVRFDNYEVHRLLPKSQRHLDALKKLENDNQYNFWSEPMRLNGQVDVMVPPHKRSEFAKFVRGQEMTDEIMVENVQRLIDEEQASISTRSPVMDWNSYHSLEEFEAWMVELTKKYKHVKSIVVGKTYENRDIKGIEITFGENLRTVFIESGIHAREWISPAATSYVVNEILKSWKFSNWRKFNYIYIPFFNPDGYAYTWTTNRMWRKTRTPYKIGRTTCYGADPNRNWDFHWNENGGSTDPCSETYVGPRPFSEIETKTLSEFLKKNAAAKKMDVYLAFHSYSQLIMYPWGWSPSDTPYTNTWKRIGDLAAKDLAAVNKEVFKVGDIYHIIYPASGSSLDWYYGNFNSTISYVYELRDKGRYGFVLPPQYILPSGKELYASLKRIIKEYLKLPSKY